MSELPPYLSALLLLMTANSAPWLAGRLLGERLAAPIDGGLTLRDGTRLLGSHKTWRGLVVGALAAALVAKVCGYSTMLGLAFGALSLTGDAVSSALKRRLHLAPGAQAPLIDQVLEALLPLLVLRTSLGLTWTDVALVAGAFTALDIAATAIRGRAEHRANTH
jgi:CDP-2,3-bis-(O-geranylgeranyl)-sn-glycerol synthase